MSALFRAVALALLMVSAAPSVAADPESCPTLLKHTFARLQDEAPQSLCQHAGKVVLVVNTASYCGFTGQFDGLEKMYAKYREQGLVVIGFPSNDFGSQDPGSNKEIADFCRLTYGVKFPMMAKSVVSGPKRSAFYTALVSATKSPPTWNFHKYLIDRRGQVLAHYPSKVTPESPVIVDEIEKALQQKP